MECTKLCSTSNPTAFRLSSAQHLADFSFEKLTSELQTLAPTIWRILQEIVTPSGKYKRKEVQRHHASECIVIAVATLLRERNEHMSIVAHLIGLILWQGNVSTKVYACMDECIEHKPCSAFLDDY